MPTADDTLEMCYTGFAPLPPVEEARLLAQLGDDLGDRYTPSRFLGRGAYATVWQAEDRIAGAAVAVKRLEGHGRQQSRGFYRELSTLFRLQHNHIVRIINLLEAPSGGRYLILELCLGGSLRASISRANRLDQLCSLERASELAAQVAEGLTVAHALGFVHRDLKPENLLFAEVDDSDFYGGHGAIKLADFGLARAGQSAPIEGRLPGISGSPAYMAPEQFIGSFTPASDVYALGAILYELVHGRLPFEGTSERLAQQHLWKQPTLDETLPDGWKRLLGDLLAKAPECRPISAELPGRLRELARSTGVIVPRPAPTPVSSMPPPMVPVPAAPPSVARCLGVTAFDLLWHGRADGTSEWLAVASEAIFRLDAQRGGALRCTPFAGLRQATIGPDDAVWLVQDRQVLRQSADARGFEIVQTHHAAIDAIAPGRDGIAIWADSTLADASWSVRLPRPITAPPRLVRLADNGLLAATDTHLVRFDPNGNATEVPIAAPVRDLVAWPAAGMAVGVRIGNEAFRFDPDAGRLTALACAGPLACLRAGLAGSLIGLGREGTLWQWNEDDSARPLLRFADRAEFYAVATDGVNGAALGMANGTCWLYLQTQPRAPGE